MARARQQHPGNYSDASRIAAEFENLFRYINSAELGDKTLHELLSTLFDSDGVFDGPIALRLETTLGLQYRIGEYADGDETGWVTIATLDQLRGAAGSNLSTIEGPFFKARTDFTATSGQTEFSVPIEDDEDVLVFQNGLLLATAEYTADADTDTVTLGTGATLSDLVTVYTVRASSVSNYRRTDYIASASQAVFAFVHTDDESLVVYKNGILQRPGGAYDYTTSASTDTVTFTSACSSGDAVTVLTVENLALQSVAGLMLEGDYTNGSGYIPWAKLSVADADIAAAKVAGLVAFMANAAPAYVSATTPADPSTDTAIWIDTSSSPNVLKFWDGASWIRAAPDATLPSYTATDAYKVIRVNSTGTALEVAAVDLSSVIPKTYMGAANGVATLDSTGKLPTGQLPAILALDSYALDISGAVSNGTNLVQRIYYQTARIDGIHVELSAGTCDIQVSVDGVTYGSVIAASATPVHSVLGTPIEIDATSAAKEIEVAITNASSAADLKLTYAVAKLAA